MISWDCLVQMAWNFRPILCLMRAFILLNAIQKSYWSHLLFLARNGTWKSKRFWWNWCFPKQFCCDSYSNLSPPQSPLQSAAGVDLRMSGSVNAFVMLWNICLVFRRSTVVGCYLCVRAHSCGCVGYYNNRHPRIEMGFIDFFEFVRKVVAKSAIS